MELFGSSGYRALVGRDLMDVALQFGFAIGNMVPSALVASDTRTSSPAAKYCVMSGLLASGCRVFDAGMVPTPTLAYNCHGFGAGVMITASHNPPEYNGIKPWNPDGSAFDAHQRHRIELSVARRNAPAASWQEMEHPRRFGDAVERHIERILKDFPERLKVSVVVDAGGGAGSAATPQLLEKLGCRVTALHCSPTGFFPRNPEPTEDSLADLMHAVRAVGADLGLAHDADADRLVAVDETGRLVPGDKLLVLLARELGARTVTTTVDASMVVEESGFQAVRTCVGDAFVSQEMKRGADFGGEPCGAWIFPSISYCPDGVHAAAQVARIAARAKLSSQADSIHSYPMRRGSIRLEKYGMEQVESALERLGPVSLSHVDGVRAGFHDGWVLVRPSGTEPKIRVTAEAKTGDRVNALFDAAVQAIQAAGSRT
ncbi:MAG: phosphoglucosamine mutase [Chloroflexi bacterium]|nr:phosphoglucosamine mutase [Chloroflexota bacterium]